MNRNRMKSSSPSPPPPARLVLGTYAKLMALLKSIIKRDVLKLSKQNECCETVAKSLIFRSTGVYYGAKISDRENRRRRRSLTRSLVYALLRRATVRNDDCNNTVRRFRRSYSVSQYWFATTGYMRDNIIIVILKCTRYVTRMYKAV